MCIGHMAFGSFGRVLVSLAVAAQQLSVRIITISLCVCVSHSLPLYVSYVYMSPCVQVCTVYLAFICGNLTHELATLGTYTIPQNLY